MSDLINRKSVIDAVHTATYGFVCGTEDGDEMTDADKLVLSINKAICTAIKSLPSAQPQQVNGKLDESCTDCPLYDNDAHNCPRFNRVIPRVLEEQQVTDKLNGVPPVQPQRWIPVAEALPERGKEVLVTRDYDGRKDHNKSCRYVETASRYGEDDDVVWSSYSDEYKMNPKSHRVVAWMPLPPSYKEDEDARN